MAFVGNLNKQLSHRQLVIYRNPISFQDLGIFDVSGQTLEKMRQIIVTSSKNWTVIQFARSIVRNVKEKDHWAEVDAIYNYVRNHSRYVKDPEGTEHLQTPLIAMQQIKNRLPFEGDCDDLTIFVLSLLKAIGYKVKLIAASYSKSKQLSHVYGAVHLYNSWVPVEPINKDCMLGWEAPGITAKIELVV